jgi:hypothetical protein
LKVNIERFFPLAMPADQARELQEIERVAVCMLGARITEGVDGRLFRVRGA